MKTSTQDMERLLQDVADAKKETDDVLRYIAQGLSIISISEEEMGRLSTPPQYGNALVASLRNFIQSSDLKLANEKEVGKQSEPWFS